MAKGQKGKGTGRGRAKEGKGGTQTAKAKGKARTITRTTTMCPQCQAKSVAAVVEKKDTSRANAVTSISSATTA